MRLDLTDLRLFLDIIEAGSITRGAAQGHLALASASERLRKMEEDAGVSLLRRHARGVAPTEAGETLAHHARRMLGQQAQLREDLHEFAAGARGRITLYANTAALTTFLPARLAPWLARRPHLNIDLRERTSHDIVHAISAGLAQAGIVSDAVSLTGDMIGRLSLEPVAKDHLVVIVAPSHALSTQAIIAFDTVRHERFVGLAKGNALQAHIEAHAQAAGGPLDCRVAMKTFEGVCDMVAHGVGVGIVPAAIARRHQRRHGYRIVTLSDSWARRQLCICHAPSSTLSPSMRDLLAHLRTPVERPAPPAQVR